MGVSEVLQSEWKSTWEQEVRRGPAGGGASDLVSPGREEGEERGVVGERSEQDQGMVTQSWDGIG